MNGLLRLAFGALVAFLLAPAWSAAGEPRIILAYGDSITAGGALPAAERSRLWVRLVEEGSQGRLRMVNEGKGGRPTASLPEFEAMLGRHAQADGLVLALGANDARDITEACVPKAVANLRTMIRRARETYGADLPILLVGPTNIRKDALGPTKPIANEREAKVILLGQAYEALAREMHCDFVSLYGTVPDASLAKDGVHPDGAGNEAMAKVMLPPLLKMILKPAD